MKKNIGLMVFLLMALMILFLADSAISADKTIKTKGTLSAIETDGTVVIDDGGYELSPSVRILDSTGAKTKLENYTLPSKVYFEHEYTARGPIIKLIRELAR